MGDVAFIPTMNQLFCHDVMYDEKSTFFLTRTNKEIEDTMNTFKRARIPVRGIGRAKTIWDGKAFPDIYNLLISLDKDNPPTKDEVRSLLMRIPASLLKRGLKQDFRKRKYKYWGNDDKDAAKLFDDKLSLFYNIFKDRAGSIHDIKDIISQPRVNIKEKQKEYLIETTSKDVPAYNLKRFIGTYHSCKGLESSNVVMFDYELPDDWDIVSETRLIYVGVTRTMDTTYIVGDDFIGSFF